MDFVAHDIDANFRGGYSVSVADFNHDGKLDVIANSLAVQELAWYENPTWERHVIAPETQQIVNQAMADIDGDGIPEIAFQSSFAMQAANSAGINWIARHNGDPRQPWKVEKIDAFPTSHHVAWADLDGDGKKELINAPLIGEKSVAPTYDQDKASVFWYSPKDWKRHVVTADIPGIIHRVRPVTWDEGKREQFLVASFEGIALYRASGSGDAMTFAKQLLTPGHVEKAPRLGASDVGVGKQGGKRFFASVEPWHGNEVVIYTDEGGSWKRRVIFDKVSERTRDRRRRPEWRRPRRCGGQRQRPGHRPEPERHARRARVLCPRGPGDRRVAVSANRGQVRDEQLRRRRFERRSAARSRLYRCGRRDPMVRKCREKITESRLESGVHRRLLQSEALCLCPVAASLVESPQPSDTSGWAPR